MGLHSDHMDELVVDVAAPEVVHIGEAEAGEGAEAEEVPGLFYAAGLLHKFLVGESSLVIQGDDGPIWGNLIVVNPHQFLPREKDYRLLDQFEFGRVAFDIVLLCILVPEGPVHQPDQVLVLLLDANLLQVSVFSEVADECRYAIGIEEFKVVSLAEFADVFLEGAHRVQGGQFPFRIGTALPYKLVNPLIHRQIWPCLLFPAQRFPDF